MDRLGLSDALKNPSSRVDDGSNDASAAMVQENAVEARSTRIESLLKTEGESSTLTPVAEDVQPSGGCISESGEISVSRSIGFQKECQDENSATHEIDAESACDNVGACLHVNDSDSNETINSDFYKPKNQKKSSVTRTEDNNDNDSTGFNVACDNWYEEYIEVNGDYVKVSSLQQAEEKHEIIKDDFEYSDDKNVNEVYNWSYLARSDEDRNKIYDKWMFDLVVWERNRLRWLDHIGLPEGFHSSCDNDRTFLVKASNGRYSNSKVRCAETAEKDCNVRKAHTQTQDVFGEDWYQSERLRRHKYLHDKGLPNWYDKLLEEQNKEDVEVLSVSSDCAQLEISGDSEVIEDPCFGAVDANVQVSNECENIEDLDPFLNEIPDDIIQVYQFTDRNIWCKYHDCFKKGKYL